MLSGKLAGDDHGQVIQGFAPISIMSLSAGDVLDMTNYMAVRLQGTAQYQLNSIGDIGSLNAGQIIVRGRGVDNIKFIDAVTIEVM